MDPASHLRAFVALPLPKDMKAALAGLLPALHRVAPTKLAFVRPETWHLTLKFLGDVPLEGPMGLSALIQALAGVDFSPFDLSPGGGVFFPGPARPRVVAVGLAAGGPACRELAGAVDAALAAVGYPREARVFTPHLTVARVKDAPGRGDWRGVADQLAGAVWPACRMDRFVLYQSVLGPAGARHEALREFPARRDGRT
ncbi:RNA 2',3'-cyclic phosphodiesterase [Desulfovibrio sulfodismutans]|uniref:RNA 2',3'-cyclic phosphodiesterase n=1 Tax=Desulfolutivibrio sulfodismutans TaxID=63561 RepID=A0A7K3NMR9_9BACT|nr:RNA 2',3'-cyclic phosphodiesterase [Desulfolutivibrio sulfodismutans]NDY56499.1 RNA 2',3'-cyclic phosphodiesterase [Desulfolutivibrio sulfodismutans]